MSQIFIDIGKQESSNHIFRWVSQCHSINMAALWEFYHVVNPELHTEGPLNNQNYNLLKNTLYVVSYQLNILRLISQKNEKNIHVHFLGNSDQSFSIAQFCFTCNGKSVDEFPLVHYTLMFKLGFCKRISITSWYERHSVRVKGTDALTIVDQTHETTGFIRSYCAKIYQ